MANYVVHPGNVTLQPSGQTVFVDAGTLAANYGLSPGEYLVGTSEQEDPNSMHIHLFPRSDGKYQNIKTEVGDVPGGTLFYDHSAEWYKRKRLGISRSGLGRFRGANDVFNGDRI